MLRAFIHGAFSLVSPNLHPLVTRGSRRIDARIVYRQRPPPDRRQGAHHPLTPRQNNNRRIYDEHAMRRLFYIRHARNLRFEVLEIATLLSLRETPRSHAARRIRSHTRLADVEARTEAPDT
ncbi:MAG: MerR family DNA-binding protein [Pseudorhodoplanes sp.]|uniref:MerR family DNA-binding protein n=1 Tax=Pseudorhodoplanes sp. TaxID=1934341 RepID=UPI003D0EA360